MDITNQQGENGGYITLSKVDEEIGRLTYTIVPHEEKLIISYVMVYRAHEGKGLGKYLVEAAIKFARENNWKVYPHCSYARAVMNRMNNVEDILLK